MNARKLPAVVPPAAFAEPSAPADDLRARVDALAAENAMLADHLGRTIELFERMARRVEACWGGYAKLDADLRAMRGDVPVSPEVLAETWPLGRVR